LQAIADTIILPVGTTIQEVEDRAMVAECRVEDSEVDKAMVAAMECVADTTCTRETTAMAEVIIMAILAETTTIRVDLVAEDRADKDRDMPVQYVADYKVAEADDHSGSEIETRVDYKNWHTTIHIKKKRTE